MVLVPITKVLRLIPYALTSPSLSMSTLLLLFTVVLGIILCFLLILLLIGIAPPSEALSCFSISGLHDAYGPCDHIWISFYDTDYSIKEGLV